MGISEQERIELIELENKLALLMEEIKDYKDNTNDGVERRTTLAKMQMDVGKYTRRLRELRKFV